jgi:hypothetical protein
MNKDPEKQEKLHRFKLAGAKRKDSAISSGLLV